MLRQNIVAMCHRFGKDSDEVKRHFERVADYLWEAPDGMKMQGYNGSQVYASILPGVAHSLI